MSEHHWPIHILQLFFSGIESVFALRIVTCFLVSWPHFHQCLILCLDDDDDVVMTLSMLTAIVFVMLPMQILTMMTMRRHFFTLEASQESLKRPKKAPKRHPKSSKNPKKVQNWTQKLTKFR